MRQLISLLTVAVMALPAAAITIDGTKDAGYAPAAAVQTVDTDFGDASPLSGSELDAAYARVSGGRLYLMLTGNLEPSFNKLEVFFDTKAGGENVLSGTPDYDFDSGGPYWISTNMAGLTFDTGFDPDFHLFGRWGGGAGTDPFEVDFVDRAGGTSAMVPGAAAAGVAGANMSAGVILAGDVGPNASGTSLSADLLFAINNTNTAGVGGGTGAADTAAALAVTTGMEFSIALADLGNPAVGSTIKIAAMINNGDHNYLSNQVLGGLPAGQGNLGGDGVGGFTGTLGGVDFNSYAGLQCFSITIIPEPSSIVLVGMALMAMFSFSDRRRK